MGDVTIGGATAETQRRAAPLAYLDTNLVSALAKNDQPAEGDALFELVELMHENRIALVASELVGRRLTLSVDEQMLWPTTLTNRGGSHVRGPGVVKKADLGALEEILPDANDARHIFQALQNGATYFVTADKRTILSHRAEVEAAFPIRVVAPTHLLAELTAES